MSEEFQSVIEGKCALPLPSRMVFRLTGTDRIRFFNGQSTQDISKCAVGAALQSAICSAKGKLQGEAVVARGENELFIDFPAVLEESLPPRIERYIIADDVEMSAITAPSGAIHVLGETPPELGKGWILFQSNRFRRPGWDCWSEDVPNRQLPFPVASSSIAEHIRLECFVPSWEQDIEPESLAPEFYSEKHAIRYDKGCYIGQEVIARIKSRGRVNRKCCLLEGEVPVSPDALPLDILSADGKATGTLTSCQQTMNGGAAVKAIGTVQHPFNEPGSEVTVQSQRWKVVQSV